MSKKDVLYPASSESEYKQMKRDVKVHGDKERAVEKARRAVKFVDVMAEESTATATEFPAE